MAPIIMSTAWALAGLVPDIARWLTGSDKAGDAAKDVVDLALRITGETRGDAAVQRLTASNQALIEYRREIQAKADDMDKAYLADVANARQRDVDLAKAGRTGNKRADIMVLLAALGTVAGLVGLLVLGILVAKYPGALSEGVFSALLVQLTTVTSIFGLCLRDAFQFEFGSSRGSVTKGDQQNELIAQLSGAARK